MKALKKRSALNNTTLRAFLVEDLDSLELGKDIYVSDSTLKRIAQQCKEMRVLKLVGCVALTDTMVQYLVSRLKMLRQLHLEDCKYLSDMALQHLAKHCSQLRSLTLVEVPLVTPQGLERFLKSMPALQAMVVKDCDKLTEEHRAYLSQAASHLHRWEYHPPQLVHDVIMEA